MSNLKQLASQTFERGYISTKPITGIWDGSIFRAQGCWIRPNGRVEVWRGISLVSAQNLGTRVFPIDQYRGEIAGGNLASRPSRAGFVRYRGSALFFLSEHASAQVYLNESTTTPFTLTGVTTSSTPYKLRVAIPDAAGTTYTPYDAGLAAPMTAPTVAKLTTGVKAMIGSYSLLVCRKRVATQTISNPSPVSLQTLEGTDNKFLVTLPSTISGQDAWVIGGTFSGYGTSGPWYEVRDCLATPSGTVSPVGGGSAVVAGTSTKFLTELAVDDVVTINAVDISVLTVDSDVQFTATAAVAAGSTQTVTLKKAAVEWFNAELGQIIEFDNDLPPLAQGVFVFNDVLCLWGTYGLGQTPPGPAISPAKASNPEAFSALATVYMGDGEEIKNVYPAEGRVYVTTTNTLQVLTPAGLADTPFIARPIWRYGFPSAAAGVIADQTFYGFCNKGAARTTAQDGPDFSFASAVQYDMSGWTAANVVVGFDPKNMAVVYFHYPGSGVTTAIPFMLQTQTWSTPMEIGSQVIDTATVNGILYLMVKTGVTCQIYEWDSTAGGTIQGTPYVATPYSDANAEGIDKNVTRVEVVGLANNAYIYTNGADLTSTGAAAVSYVLVNTTEGPEPVLRANVRQAKLFAIRVDLGATLGHCIDEVACYGNLDTITR